MHPREVNNLVGQPDTRMSPILFDRDMSIPLTDEEKGYSSVDRRATPETAKVIARSFEKYHHLPEESINDDGVIVTGTGARGALTAFAQYVNAKSQAKGRDVIIFTPGYFYYGDQLKFNAGLNFKPVPYGPNCLDAIDHNTALVVVTLPNNPDGRTNADFLGGVHGFYQALIERQEHYPGLYIVDDAIYNKVRRNYTGKETTPALHALAPEKLRSRSAVVNSLAKNENSPAYRAGYLITAKEVADFIEPNIKNSGQGPGNAYHNRLIKTALTELLVVKPEYYIRSNRINDGRMQYLYDRLSQIEGFNSPIPEAGILYPVTFDRDWFNAEKAVIGLAQNLVKVRSGKDSGLRNHIRINAAAPLEDLELIAAGIEKICRGHRADMGTQEVKKPSEDFNYFRQLEPQKSGWQGSRIVSARGNSWVVGS